jgi:hypothetical protein
MARETKFHDPALILVKLLAVNCGNMRFSRRHSMADQIAEERADHLFSQPFIPGQPTGPSADQIRIAHALEYIAAQMGVIARKAVKTESLLAKIAAHYPGSAE